MANSGWRQVGIREFRFLGSRLKVSHIVSWSLSWRPRVVIELQVLDSQPIICDIMTLSWSIRDLFGLPFLGASPKTCHFNGLSSSWGQNTVNEIRFLASRPEMCRSVD